jgi:ABC-type proline/glycine betaine transport system permease subunit
MLKNSVHLGSLHSFHRNKQLLDNGNIDLMNTVVLLFQALSQFVVGAIKTSLFFVFVQQLGYRNFFTSTLALPTTCLVRNFAVLFPSGIVRRRACRYCENVCLKSSMD